MSFTIIPANLSDFYTLNCLVFSLCCPKMHFSAFNYSNKLLNQYHAIKSYLQSYSKKLKEGLKKDVGFDKFGIIEVCYYCESVLTISEEARLDGRNCDKNVLPFQNYYKPQPLKCD